MTRRDPRTILRERFGHESLYPLQQRIVDHILQGRHALVVLPTGSGKSLCYQLPALTLPDPGTTVVFSPLIALMEDQVTTLKQRGVRAEFINSTLDRQEREARYAALARGEYEMVYVTPERMQKVDFLAAIDSIPGGVPLLAIDEAHCITKWGHDFRPAYQEVGEFRRRLGSPVTVALTATATPEVRTDIWRTLGIDEAEMPLFASGIDRPNLDFSVRPIYKREERVDAILDIASTAGGTGIAYFTLIKTLEEAADEIRAIGWPGSIEIYHGQLDPAEKKRVYDRFAASRPEDQLLLLATNAFGMGVDKSDIRSIVHAQVPGSVEAYYQEVGRAGRDGKPSSCILLYDPADLAIQQGFINWMNPCADLLSHAAFEFQKTPEAEHSIDELRLLITGKNRGDRRAEYCAITLEKLGVIEPTAVPETYRFVRPLRDEELSPEEIAAKKERDLRRLLHLLELTRADDIRAFVLEYFGLDETASESTPASE